MSETTRDLCYLSAVEALGRFRAGDLSPVELLEALIARAEEVEPTVNALCVTFYDEALAAARKAEARYLAGDAEPRPLEGLPVAVKDELAVAGQPCAGGSLVYRDLVADESAIIAERLLAAGAIVHARTTTPEFSCAAFTHSRLWGVTRNPWNPAFAVGGSSGGSAAALACGTAALATGSDIGGSIRIPSSFCGVVGFKPPHGRVPVEPPYNMDQYCHEGPMARTVADCALFQNVLAGPDPRDLVCVAPKLEIPLDRLNGGGREGAADTGLDDLRIALVAVPGDYPVDDDVARNTRAAGDAFREAGAVVDEVALEVRREDVSRAMMIHFGALFGDDIAQEAEAHEELLTRYAVRFARDSRAILAESSFGEGLQLEARIAAAVSAVLVAYDLLVLPTVLTRGLTAGDDYVGHGITVGGVELPRYDDALITPLINIASRCPVLAVPSGFADNGVPTGIQIAGRPYQDVTVFRAGAACERLRPWLDAPARRPLQGREAAPRPERRGAGDCRPRALP